MTAKTGRRTVVIGDIHGCCRELKKLMAELRSGKKYDPQRDTLVFLGDYI